MVDKRFYWPELKGDGSINPSSDIQTLTNTVIKNTLGQFIINPHNRENSEFVPERIEDIEDNTKRHGLSWDDEKEQWFKEALQSQYTLLLNTDLDELVNEFVPVEKKTEKGNKSTDKNKFVTWVDELFLKDFDLKLKDFKNDAEKIKQWVGELHEFGKTDKTKIQRELTNNSYQMSQKEFFDSGALQSPIVKYDRVNGVIKYIITVDHESGDVNRKIVKRGWPNSEIIIDSSYNGNYTYKHDKEMKEATEAKKGKKGWESDPTNVWYKTEPEAKNIKVFDDEEYERLLNERAKLKPWEEGYGEYIKRPTKKIKNPHYGELRNSRLQEMALEELGANWQQQLRRDSSWFDKKGFPEKWKEQLIESKTDRDNPNAPENQIERYRQKKQEEAQKIVKKIDRENTIKFDNPDAFEILAISQTYKDTGRQDTSYALKEIFNRNKDKVFEHIKNKIDLSPIPIAKYKIIFEIRSPDMLREHNIEQGDVWLPTTIIVKSSNKISLPSMYKVSKKPTTEKKEGQQVEKPAYIPQPRVKGNKEIAYSIRDTAPKSGFNEARQYFAKLIQNNLQELTNSAPYLK